MIHTKRKRGLAAIAVAAGLLTPLVAAPSAEALGNNRVVYRSCGSNYVASGRLSSGTYWAQTSKNDGGCKGRLSVAVEYTNGGRSTRVYGSSTYAYITRTTAVRYGLHWGCDDCNVTYS